MFQGLHVFRDATLCRWVSGSQRRRKAVPFSSTIDRLKCEIINYASSVSDCVVSNDWMINDLEKDVDGSCCGLIRHRTDICLRD